MICARAWFRAALFVVLAAVSAASAAARFGPYEAELLRVLDGDTFDMRVHIWPHPLYNPTVRVRLANADAPEMDSSLACEREKAAAAFDLVSMWFRTGKRIEIVDVVADSLGGRYRARVLIDGVDIGESLKATGYGRVWKRGDKTPWCTP